MKWLITISLLAGLVSPCLARGVPVTVTAFRAHRSELTSLGTRPIPGYTISVSRDLKHLVGRKVSVSWKGGKATGYVESVTHERLKMTVDILVRSKREAKNFERKRGELGEI